MPITPSPAEEGGVQQFCADPRCICFPLPCDRIASPVSSGTDESAANERKKLAKQIANEEVRPLRDLYERSYQASRYAELHPADYGAMCSEEMHNDEFWDAVKVAIAKERRAAASAKDLAEIWRGFATAAGHALAPLGDDFAFEDPDGLAGAISRLIAALAVSQDREREARTVREQIAADDGWDELRAFVERHTGNNATRAHLIETLDDLQSAIRPSSLEGSSE